MSRPTDIMSSPAGIVSKPIGMMSRLKGMCVMLSGRRAEGFELTKCCVSVARVGVGWLGVGAQCYSVEQTENGVGRGQR